MIIQENYFIYNSKENEKNNFFNVVHTYSITEIFKDSHSILKKDHTLAFSMRCMTDHHLKLCRQGCKFCISSLASNGERKKFPFPPFLKCLWCSPHPGEFLVPTQPLERPDQKETGCFMYLLLWMSNGAEGLLLCTILSFVTKGINLGGASGMITMSKYYERPLYQQLLLLLFIKGRIGKQVNWDILWSFWPRDPSAITACCWNS